MNLEILLSATDLTDFSIVEKNNIASDVIIVNQTDDVAYDEKEYPDFTARMYTSNETGIGKSRNNALMRSEADICLLSDDDVVYRGGYEEIILNEFEQQSDADMIIFDLNIIQKSGFKYVKNKNERVHHFNLMNHGAPKIAFKREKILQKNISFSLLFGGGATYGSGEDSLFIRDALDHGLTVMSVDKMIADVYNDDSSWFKGFNEKYLFDRGAMLNAVYPKRWPQVAMQFVDDYYEEYAGRLSKKEMFLKIAEGAEDFENYGSKPPKITKQVTL